MKDLDLLNTDQHRKHGFEHFPTCYNSKASPPIHRKIGLLLVPRIRKTERGANQEKALRNSTRNTVSFQTSIRSRKNGRVVAEKADRTRRVIPGKHNSATSWRLPGLEIGHDSGKTLRNSIQNVAPEKTTQSAPQKSQKWPRERTRRARHAGPGSVIPCNS